MGASRYHKLHRNRRRKRAYRHRQQGRCRLFHTGCTGGDLLPPAERHGAHPARVGRLAACLRRSDADRGAFVPEHRLRVQYPGCSDCARRRAGRRGRRSAAHRAGQDRRLLCGPTRQPCPGPFGQGQFHLAVLISTLPPKDGVIGLSAYGIAENYGVALQADGETRSASAASSIRRRSTAWTILLDWMCADDAGKVVREARVASEPEALLQVLTNRCMRDVLETIAEDRLDELEGASRYSRTTHEQAHLRPH